MSTKLQNSSSENLSPKDPKSIREIQFSDWRWIDVTNPSVEDLDKLGDELNLHEASIKDCLEPEHLPKFEKFGDISFVILRSFDSSSKDKIPTVQSMTRKLAIFLGPRFCLTIHRTQSLFLDQTFRTYQDRQAAPGVKENEEELTSWILVGDLFEAVARTFQVGIEDSYNKLESFETEVFSSDRSKKLKLQNSYTLKRKVSVLKRMLRLSLEPLHSFIQMSSLDCKPILQSHRETYEKYLFQIDEIHESLTSLLSLQISLVSQRTNEASHRTNEVMRVLTIFSVFFLPLNFLASIYGMNFEHMPELESKFGYPAVLLAMGGIVLTIFIWFRVKGWLNNPVSRES